MKDIKLQSTSRTSAITEALVLRETETTRLVFKPLIIDNLHDQKASVKGVLVFQRKTKKQEWIDYKELSFSQLKATEWVKMELRSDEVLKLYKHLTDLYELYRQEGIPLGESRFLRANEGLGVLVNANEKDLNQLLNRESDNASELLSRLLHWLSRINSPNQTIDSLERLDISGLQQLSSVVGLTNLKASYQIWENNRENPNEEFWQTTLEKYPFILSQIFAYPIVVVEGKAYVGGKSVANSGGNLVDFFAQNQVSKNAVLIELKTPATPLLGSQYRGDIYNISKDLSGAVIQVSNYKHSLESDYYALRQQSGNEFGSFEPACVVVAGNFKREFDNALKVKSFELFRSHLSGVEIITYDELFGKVKLLIDLLEGNIATTNGNLIAEENVPF